jgi:glycosyltransferase involved in cell wall biosynthesis
VSLRVAIIVSHPIQHFAPWYREVARRGEVELKVFFSTDLGISESRDRDFGVTFKWDVPLTEGYDHEFPPDAERRRGLGFFAQDIPGLAAGLDRFDPQLLQVHGYAGRSFWRAAAWARRRGRPLLLSSDTHLGEYAWLPAWKRIAKDRLWLPRVYRRFDGALYVGDGNRAFHRRYGLPEERLFPGCLPIDRERLLAGAPDRAAARREVRARHGVPEDAFVVLFCGKFVARKRALDLVTACSEPAASGSPPWLLLVGEGEQRGAIEALVARRDAQRVVITGFVNQSAIPAYFAASDVLAVPSEIDPHPLVVTEAACFGLPVVASDAIGCVGPNDTARPGENALVHRCGDAQQLREAIERLRGDAGLLRRMSEASQRISEGQDLAAAARSLVAAARALQRLGPR